MAFNVDMHRVTCFEPKQYASADEPEPMSSPVAAERLL